MALLPNPVSHKRRLTACRDGEALSFSSDSRNHNGPGPQRPTPYRWRPAGLPNRGRLRLRFTRRRSRLLPERRTVPWILDPGDFSAASNLGYGRRYLQLQTVALWLGDQIPGNAGIRLQFLPKPVQMGLECMCR